MTKEKILSVVALYRVRLEQEGVLKKRMDPKKCFGQLSKEEVLAHAYFLLDGVEEYADDPTKAGKTGRHLASVQMCLSFANWYTLEELMTHNRSD